MLRGTEENPWATQGKWAANPSEGPDPGCNVACFCRAWICCAWSLLFWQGLHSQPYSPGPYQASGGLRALGFPGLLG